MQSLYHAAGSVDIATLLLASASALLIWFYPKAWAQKNSITYRRADLGSLFVALFCLPIETIGTRFGGIPQGLPDFNPPDFSHTTPRHLTVAVEVGLLIAVFSFIRRITELTHVSIAEESPQHDDGDMTLIRKAVPRGVVIYRVYGALFFGAADKLETILANTHTEPDVLILKMQEVISMDASALHTLDHLYKKLRKHDKHLILCGPHTQPYFLMQQAGFFAQVGTDNVTANLDEALKRAKLLLMESKQ